MLMYIFPEGEVKDKKTTILIVLSIGAVISLIYGITAPPPGRARRRASATAGQTAPGKDASSARKAALPTVRLSKETAYKGWKRNPFVPTGSSGFSELTLGGIMWQERNPRAVINGSLVGEGDAIDDYKVVEIERDHVKLKSVSGEITLNLKD